MEKMTKKKMLKPTLASERAQLARDRAIWEREKINTFTRIDKHYQTHEGGGLYYRWFSEECFWMDQELEKRKKQLALRESKEANRKQNGITMGR